MNTVVLEVRSLARTLSDASRAMQTGRGEEGARIAFATVLNRTPEGSVEFPFDAVRVEFLLKAA